MSAAKVTFEALDYEAAAPGAEARFSFQCPLHPRQCSGLLLNSDATRAAGIKRDPQGANGGRAMWDWDGNRTAPTLSPSINCGGCWHGYIQKGRCVSVQGIDEPEPPTRRQEVERLARNG